MPVHVRGFERADDQSDKFDDQGMNILDNES